MPKRDKQWRIERAMLLDWRTDMTYEEIGEQVAREVGREDPYTRGTVAGWMSSHDEISEHVSNAIDSVKEVVMVLTIDELKSEFTELHSQLDDVKVSAQEAEVAVKSYTDEDGNVVWEEGVDDGEKYIYKVPQEFVQEPDEQTRYFRRSEWREIRRQIREVLEELRKVVGVETAEQIEIDMQVDHGVDEQTRETIENMDFQI